MLYFVRFVIAFLTAYFFGRIIYFNFCNPKDKHNIISKFHSLFLGLGFTSIFFWFYTIATNGYNTYYHIIEICFVAIFYLYLWSNKRNKPASSFIANRSKNKVVHKKKRLLINYLIVILFSFIGVLTLISCLRYPDGTWDALSMWNFRAKYLSLGNEEWNRMYFPVFEYSHRDYPLFVPCIIARSFNFVGKFESAIPLFFSWFFTLITFILLYLYLKKLKNKYYSVVAVCILSYSPNYIFQGGMQYADIPLAVFILISLYEFVIWNMNKKNLPWLGMMFASLSFWIKNEGVPWFIIYCLLIIYCLYKKEKKLSSSIKNFIKVFMVSVPVILSYLTVRYFANGENDLVLGIVDRLKQMFIFERHEMILAYVRLFLIQNYWILFIPIMLFLGFVDEKYKNYKYILFMILLMYLVFIFIYLITPHDLAWHLKTSFLRITIIYLPSLLFISCLLFDLKRNMEESN